jgi:hypothetical protein
VADALPIDAVVPGLTLRPAGLVVGHHPRLDLDDVAQAAVRHGRTVPAPPGLAGTVALWHRGDVAAMAEVRDEGLRPIVVLEGA